MASRIAAFVGLMLLAAGGLLLAERVSEAQPPTAPAANAPAEQPAPKVPAATTLAPPVAEKSAPIVSAPPVEAKPAPVAAAPPEKPTPPVVAAPLPKPKPAVADVPLPRPKPALTLREKEKGVAASLLFGAKKLPSTGAPQAIGYYSHGCLQGGMELPSNGPHWQVMRPSRNRNWGHPELVGFIKRLSASVAKATGWPGILIGDMAQPRGGPLPFGHTSHQVGLDVDIWYMPMPDRILTKQERETLKAARMVADDGLSVNKNWTDADAAFVRTVAEQPQVERVLVNAAVKKKMCELAGKHHYAWMTKLRPWYFHTSHIHVRLKCPAGSPHCQHQPAVPEGDRCAKKDLAYWFSKKALEVKAQTPREKLEHPITMAKLPTACQTVLNAPAKKTDLAIEDR